MLTCTTHCRRVSNSILKASLIHGNQTVPVDGDGTLVLLKPLHMGLPPLGTHYTVSDNDHDCNCVFNGNVMFFFFCLSPGNSYTITPANTDHAI